MPDLTSLVEVSALDRWPFWLSGIAIGAFVIAFLFGAGRMLGVSTGFSDACAAPFDKSVRRSWRFPFLIGIVGGGLIAALVTGAFQPSFAVGVFDQLLTASLPVKAAVFTGGGILLGFGSRLAGGCTSGHGIVGMAQIAPSSLMATASFMVAGFAITNLLLRVIGG